jgi:HEPN domain-containing protein
VTSGPTDTGGESAASGGTFNVATLTATLTANIAPFQAAIRTIEQGMGQMDRATVAGSRALQQAANAATEAFGKSGSAVTQLADQVTASHKQMTAGVGDLNTELDRLLARASQLTEQGLLPAGTAETFAAQRQEVQGLTGDLMALKAGLEEIVKLGEEGGLALPAFLRESREELDRLNFDIAADGLRRVADRAGMAQAEVQAIVDSAKTLADQGGYADANRQLAEATQLIEDLSRTRIKHAGAAMREAQAMTEAGNAALAEVAAMEALRRVTSRLGEGAPAEKVRSDIMSYIERSNKMGLSEDVMDLVEGGGRGRSAEGWREWLERRNKMLDEISAMKDEAVGSAATNWYNLQSSGDLPTSRSVGALAHGRSPLPRGDDQAAARQAWFGPMSQSLGQISTRYPGAIYQLGGIEDQVPWDYARLGTEALDFSTGAESASRAQQAAEQATMSWMGAASQATSTLTELAAATWEFGGAVQQLDTALSQSTAAELIQQQWSGLEQRLNRLKSMVPSLYSEISGMADKVVRSWDQSNRPITKGSGLGRIGDIASGGDAESVGAEVAQLEAAVARAEGLAPMLTNLQQQVMQLNELRFDGLINEFHRLTTQVQGSTVADALTEQYRKLGTEGTQQLRQAIETQRSLIAEMARSIAQDMSPIASTITEAQAAVGQFRLDQVLAQLGDLGDRAGLTIGQVDALREGLNRMAEVVGLDMAVQKANELTAALQAQAQALTAPPPDAVLEVMTRMRDVAKETAELSLDRLVEQFYMLAEAAQMSEADTEAVLDAVQRIAAVNPQAAVQSLSQASQAVAGLAREVEAAKQPSQDLQVVSTVLQGTLAKTAEVSFAPLLRQFEQVAERAGYTEAEVAKVRDALTRIADTEGVETANNALRQLIGSTSQLAQAQEATDQTTAATTSRVLALGTAFRAMRAPVAGMTGAMTQAQTATAGVGAALGGLAGPAAIAVAAIAAVSLALKGLWAASKESAYMEAQSAAFDRAFGGMADAARNFSDRMGEAVALTGHEMEALYKNLQLFLVGSGLTEQAAATAGASLMRLAGDVAAARGTVEEFPAVLSAIQMGAMGSSESLRRYGISIRMAEVSQRALIASGKESVQSLTEQERILAFVQLASERAGYATGALADAQDSNAKRVADVQRAYRDVAETLKMSFLPVLEALVPAALAAAEALKFLMTPVRWLVEGVGWLGKKLAEFAGAVANVDDRIRELNAAGEEIPGWMSALAVEGSAAGNALREVTAAQAALEAAAKSAASGVYEEAAALESARLAALGIEGFLASGWNADPGVEALRRIAEEAKTAVEWLDEVVAARLAATNQQYALLRAIDAEGELGAQIEGLRRQGKAVPPELVQQFAEADMRVKGLWESIPEAERNFSLITDHVQEMVDNQLLSDDAAQSLLDKLTTLESTVMPRLEERAIRFRHALLPDAEALDAWESGLYDAFTQLQKFQQSWGQLSAEDQGKTRAAIAAGLVPPETDPNTPAYMERFAGAVFSMPDVDLGNISETLRTAVESTLSTLESEYGIVEGKSMTFAERVGFPLVRGIIELPPFADELAGAITADMAKATATVGQWLEDNGGKVVTADDFIYLDANTEVKLSADLQAQLDRVIADAGGHLEVVGGVSGVAQTQVGAPIGAGVASPGDFSGKLAANVITEIEQALKIVRASDAVDASSPSETWAYYIGEPIGQGIAEGITRTQQDIVQAAQGVIQQALSAAQAPISFQQAQISLRQAERNLDDLKKKRDEIQPDVDIGFGMGITAAEQVGIEDAERRLWLAKKAHEAGVITDAQLMVAEENLEDVQRQASDTSDELARLDDQIASAELAVASGQLAIVSSFMAMVQAGSEMTPEMEAVFRDIAEMAGLPQATIDELVGHMQTAAQAAVDFGDQVDAAMVQAAAAATNGAASAGGALGGLADDFGAAEDAAWSLEKAIRAAFAAAGAPTTTSLPEVTTVVGALPPAATSAGAGGVGWATDQLTQGTEVIGSSTPPPFYQPFTPMQQPEVPAWAYRAPEMPKTVEAAVEAVLPAEFTDEVRSAINGGFSGVEVNVPEIQTPKMPEVKVPEVPTAKLSADLATAVGKGFGSVRLPEVNVDNHNEFLIPEPGSFWPDVSVDVAPLRELVSAGFTGVTGAIERAQTPTVTVQPSPPPVTTEPIVLYSSVQIDGKEVAKAVKRWEHHVNGR